MSSGATNIELRWKGFQRANAKAFKLSKDKHSTLFDLFVSDNIYYLYMSSGATNI